VQQRDATMRAEPRERRLELEGLLDRFLDEPLDRGLAPRPERTAPKAAGKALHAGKAHPVHFRRFAIEHGDPGVGQNPANLILLAALVIVVSKHGDHRNLDRRRQLARQNARFLRQAVVGEIAAQHEHVGGGIDLAEYRLEGPLGRLRDMNIAEGGNPHMGSWRGRPFGHEYRPRFKRFAGLNFRRPT
jgi:hypothetical protein